MGFLKKMRAKSAYSTAIDNYQQELVAWEEETEHVDTLLYMAENLDEVYSQAAAAGFSVRLKKGEHVLIGLQGATALIEPRSGGGSYQGGSRGTSIRVAKGVSFRVGAHRGTYVPNPDIEKAIDTDGDVYITTQRVLYTSPGRSREWAYKSAVDLYHADNWSGTSFGITYIVVSNRQKTSGFAA